MSESWLEALEDKVREAALELRRQREETAEQRAEAVELRQRTEELEAKVEDLEAQLETAVTERDEALQRAEGDGAEDGDEGAAAWAEERDAIRERVERLVDHLGDLLDEAT